MQKLQLYVYSQQPAHNDIEILYQTSLTYVRLAPGEHALAGSQAQLNLNDLAQTETLITFDSIFPKQIADPDENTISLQKQRPRLSTANMQMATALVKETSTPAIIEVLSARETVWTGGVTSLPLV